MITISATSFENGSLVIRVLNLCMFSDYFARLLRKAATLNMRMRLKTIEARRVGIDFFGLDGTVFYGVTIDIPDSMVGLAHAMIRHGFCHNQNKSFFWESDEERVCDFATLEQFIALRSRKGSNGNFRQNHPNHN